MTEEKFILTRSGIEPVDRIRSKAWTREAHHIYIDMRNLMGSLAEASEWEMAAIAAEVLQVWKEQMKIATSLLDKIQQLRHEDQVKNSKAGKYHHIAVELVTEIGDMERHLMEALEGSGLGVRLHKAVLAARIGLDIVESDVELTDRPKSCSCYPWYGHHFKECAVVKAEVEAILAERAKTLITWYVTWDGLETEVALPFETTANRIIREVLKMRGKHRDADIHFHMVDDSETYYAGSDKVPYDARELRMEPKPSGEEIQNAVGNDFIARCIINGVEYEIDAYLGMPVTALIEKALAHAEVTTYSNEVWRAHREDGTEISPEALLGRKDAKLYISRPPGVGA